MSRLTDCFAELSAQKRQALIPFITAGDPAPVFTVPMMHALVAAGANILELGVPFSDPMADGPVIQRASERALAQHTTLAGVLDLVSEFRKTDRRTPVVLMGYLNPIEIMGAENFAGRARLAGVDGVLTVDLPPEEGDEILPALRAQKIDPVFLLSPTTNETRMQKITQAASGFVYYVSLKGVTGASSLNVAEVSARVQAIKKHTALPVGVGFGVKDGSTAAQLAQVADAVVVGSALVALVEQHGQDEKMLLTAISHFVSGLRQAMDAGDAGKNLKQAAA